MVFVPPRDRVLERSTSNSQTVFSVTGALDTSFNRFSAAMSVGDTTIGGVVERGVAFKSGILTYNATNQVTVTTTKESKGTFSASGIKEVFMGLPALVALMFDGAQTFTFAQKAQARSNIDAINVHKGHLFGLTLSAAGSTATFGIAAGDSADSTAVDLLTLGSAFTKTTASWAVGTGNGALDTGTTLGAANTWYHVFIIKRPDTSLVDVLFSLSPTAPTLPTNYTLFRRIGSMKTDGSKQWIKFAQLGDRYLWDVPVATAWAAATSAALITLTVPTGFKLQPLFAFFTNGTDSVYFSSPDTSDQVPGNALGSFRSSSTLQVPINSPIWTNTSAQIRARADGTTGSGASFNVYGWIDDRGRLA